MRKSLPQTSLIRSQMAMGIRIRFSRLPPHLSVRVLMMGDII